MILTPVVSEKALGLAEQHTYVFWVPRSASKVSIAKEVASRFKVKVASVNVVNSQGKPKRLVIKRGRKVLPGKRASSRKAYVKLAAGQSIALFKETKK